METRSCSRRRSQTFDFGIGIQPAHIMYDDEQDEDPSMIEMQGFAGMDPSSVSCSVSQPDSGGGGDAACTSLNSAVQALRIVHLEDN